MDGGAERGNHNVVVGEDAGIRNDDVVAGGRAENRTQDVIDFKATWDFMEGGLVI